MQLKSLFINLQLRGILHGFIISPDKGRKREFNKLLQYASTKKSTEHGTALLIQTKKTCLTQNCPTFSGFSDVDHHGNRQLQLL